METLTSTAISLETGCDFDVCAEFAFPLHKQLAGGRYDRCSVMEIPEDVGPWRNQRRTARKRADRAALRGYTFKLIRRHERADEIQEINLSAPVRQGRRMSDGYHRRPSETPLPVYPCLRHRVATYGVEAPDGVLVAYLWLYRAGQLDLVSQILGHADHLENEIMYLLWQGMVSVESSDPDGYIVYNRHDSGTDGLRFFKERVGLAETQVEWLP
jgi:hypothetical protein